MMHLLIVERTDPEHALRVPEDYLKRVGDVHEKGGYGSLGSAISQRRTMNVFLIEIIGVGIGISGRDQKQTKIS